MKYYSDKTKITIITLDNLVFLSNKYNRNYIYNPVSNITSWISTEISEVTPVNLEDNWSIITSKKYNVPYFYNTLTKESQWNLPQIDSCTGKLEWTGNSCYIDSVLQSLFIVPNDFTNMLLTTPIQNSTSCDVKGIQTELNRIVNTIRNNAKTDKVTNVTRLRQLMQTCPESDELWNTSLHDAGEFLQYLLDLFPNTNIATKQVITYGTNDLGANIYDKVQTSVTEDTDASVIITIDPFTLLQFESAVSTQDLITITHDSGELESPLVPDEGPGAGQKFSRQLSEMIIIDSPIIILNVLRNNPLDEDQVITTNIIPEEKIILKSGKKFNLSAIVIFRPAHYVCYYKCNTNWYFYNDLPPAIVRKLDNFNAIFETLSDGESDSESDSESEGESEVTTHGTLYFYTKS